MNAKQAIKNAKVIRVKTSIGSTVAITKKEAYRYVNFVESNNYDLQMDVTEIGNGKLLVHFG